MGAEQSLEPHLGQLSHLAAAIPTDGTCSTRLQLLALTGPLATAETKALRYRLLHVPALLAHSARRRHLRLPAT
jgi:hypothetical protein